MLKLSLDAIQVIDAIERFGSFSGAAEHLHKVPSTISYTVTKLEEQLGMQLFERHGPRVVLTRVGQELLKEGRWLVVVAGDLECRLRRIATGYESELRFVHDSIIPSAAFVDDVAAFEALKCGTRLLAFATRHPQGQFAERDIAAENLTRRGLQLHVSLRVETNLDMRPVAKRLVCAMITLQNAYLRLAGAPQDWSNLVAAAAARGAPLSARQTARRQSNCQSEGGIVRVVSGRYRRQ